MTIPSLILILSISIVTIYCVSVVPERANVTMISDKYIVYARLYVTRKSRKSPYYINLEGRMKHTWGNNVTANFVFYEYLHNEYRRTFVEIHSRYCDLLDKDPYIGSMLKERGVVCPSPPAEYKFLNMSVPMATFPYTIPFYKFRIDIVITHTDTKEIIGKAYFYGAFKDK